MSVSVIALVVWLLLVFLSVTDGIEKNWLEKLTSLNAPVKITPTRAYFSSYYYLSDTVSAASGFEAKSIGQKAESPRSDPYDPASDAEMPPYWPAPDKNPDGTLKDPVKTAYAILDGMKEVSYQEFEVSGAMLKLQMLRSEAAAMTVKGSESQSFLTQVSYIASFADKSPYVQSLVLEPSVKDLNQLFFLANQEGEFARAAQNLVENVDVLEVKPSHAPWRLPFALLPEDKPLLGEAHERGGFIAHIMLSENGKQQLVRRGSELLLDGRAIPSNTPLFCGEAAPMKASLLSSSLQGAKALRDLRFSVEGKVQGKTIAGEMAWDGIEIAKASPKVAFSQQPSSAPLWPHRLQSKMVLPAIPSKERGILLAKNFRDTGVRIGDKGYLSYQAATTSSLQEQRIPVYVSGFYDPGVMSIGGKCILVPPAVARAINAASQSQHFDKTASNGIQVWFKDIKQTENVQKTLQEAFEKAGIAPYWNISTYRDYDFAKDLLLQFQSDRVLFTLIGVIILMVACCNIISLLVILVNDKKREIGILQAMGASRGSIALIFGGSGIAMGLVSSLIGIGIALLTLSNLDNLVGLLSFLQGHDAFNAAFYGSSLPNQLSYDALLFVLVATPILSLLAGLVPAIKACRVRPSAILRSE